MSNDFLKTIKKLSNITTIVKREYSELSKEILKEIISTHKSEQDPDKHNWLSTRNSWPTLNKSGALIKGYKTYKTQDGFTIANTVPYAGFHQTGTIKLPIRKLLLSPNKHLPIIWLNLIKNKLNKILAQKLK